MVEDYVEKALHDARQYTNSAPLDESGVYSLHRLAAAIYAEGWRDGHIVGSDTQRAARNRAKEADHGDD